MQLRSDFQRVREASDALAYQGALVAFAERLDFSTVSAIMVVERVQQATKFLSISNTPAEFEAAFNSAEDGKRDPVLQRLKRMNFPVLWDQRTYVEDGAADLWERQAPYGYHTGIGLVLHLPAGRHFYLGVDRRAPLPSNEHKLSRILADLQLLAVCAQDTAARLFAEAEGGPMPTLSVRELDILRWTSLGKTAGEIAQILFVSEHTVHWHAQKLMRKLSCENKHAAVRRARELGLI